MYKKRILWLGFLALVFLHLQAIADTPLKRSDPTPTPSPKSVIKGKVVEKDSNTPMEYANISIYNSADSSLVSGGITNPQGEFTLEKLNSGTYYVEANFIGFNKTRINNIRIGTDRKEINLGVIYLEASRQQITGIEVVAEKARVEYKVDKKVINVSQDINAAGGTAVDVLENTPSVQVDIEGNVTLRGSSSFTVFIDGRPTALSGSDALQQIPASALENIEIITNPSAKYDPDGMAGIINLVMKKNVLSGFDGIVNASASSNESRSMDLTLNHKNKKRQLTFGFDTDNRLFNSDQESTRETFYDDRTEYMTSNGERNFNRHGFKFKGGLDLYLTDKTTLGFVANAGKYGFDSSTDINNIYQTIYNGQTTGDNRYTVELEESDRNRKFVDASVNFLHKYNAEGTHKLEGMFYFRNRTGDDLEFQSEVQANENFVRGSIYDLQVRTTEGEESQDYRAKLDYTKPLGETGKLEAGYQSRIRRETEDYLFENFDTDIQEWINNPDFTSSMDFKRDIHAIYSTYSNKIGRFEAMGGLRGEYTNREIKHTGTNMNYKLDRFDWFPSLHTSYEIFINTQLMASYSRRIDRPGGRDLDPFPSYLNQYTIRIGNPDLKPEYTNSFDLSVMQRFGKSFISLDGFYRETSNVISRISELGDDGILYQTSANVSQDKSTGAELMLNLDLTKWLLLNTSLSVYNYKLQGEVLGEYIDKESTNFDGRMNATVKFSSTARMQLMGMYRGPSVSAQGDQKGSFYSNISYRQEFMNRKLTATVSVQDILGTASWKGNSNGTSFNSTYNFKHEPRVIQLALSFKINNYKMDNGRSGSDDTNEIEFDQGGF
ncbi:TonB-dependent receptor domain-containing protein [Mangrovibacterium sp.]|uniref:TonB-dependent receptor domain-containing protein n=1 Tax=Mangrovibacterium sp. TaxID=1961364 RepID=UPI0035621005